MAASNNWLEGIVQLPRAEYAKQTEALLTDLLWRSEGSSLSSAHSDGLLSQLQELAKTPGWADEFDPERLVPDIRPGGSKRLVRTIPIALANTGSMIAGSGSAANPVNAVLQSSLAPRARGDKTSTCVPLHPSAVALQTLHGLVNKGNPANLANAIEVIGWHGGAPSKGAVAARYLTLFQSPAANPKECLTGYIDAVFPMIAQQVWANIPASLQVSPGTWPVWPSVAPTPLPATSSSLLSQLQRTPFAWFWSKWQTLCDPAWHESLPTRRFTDWALCLLRTSLAFSYLWEAEFYSRLYDGLLLRRDGKPQEYAVSRGLDLADLLDYVEAGMVPFMPLRSGKIMIPVLEADLALAAIRGAANLGRAA